MRTITGIESAEPPSFLLPLFLTLQIAGSWESLPRLPADLDEHSSPYIAFEINRLRLTTGCRETSLSEMETYEIASDRSSSVVTCCKLGVGVDTGRLESRSTAVAVGVTSTTNQLVPSLRDSVTYSLEAVDRSELQNERTSFRGSFRATLAVISGRVSGGATFANSQARSSSYIRASVRVVRNVQSMDISDLKMLPGIDLESEDFDDLYGDSFVASVTYGGRLDALIRVSNEQKDELSEFDIRGEIDAVVATAEGSFKQTLIKATSKREVDIEIEQRGGRLLEVRLAPSIDDFLDAVKAFPSQVASGAEDASVPIAFSVLAYKDLPAVIRQDVEVKAAVGGVTKEMLLMEDVAKLVQRYEIARQILSGKIDIEGVLAETGTRKWEELRSVVMAYRSVVEQKARAVQVLVDATLDISSLDESNVDSFPLAFELIHSQAA